MAIDIKPGEPIPDLAFFEPRGDSGLKGYGGYINEEFLRKLQGKQAWRIYREMADNDATVGALLFVINALMVSLEWTVTAASDKPEAQDMKRFVEQVFFEDLSAPFHDVIAEANTMFTYGFAPLEWTPKRRNGPGHPKKALRSKFDDGRIGLRDISLRAQTSIERWEFDRETGELLGLWQSPSMRPGTSVYIPIEKTALFRTTSVKNNPEGRSLLRNVYRAWYFKSKIEEIEAVGVERDLAGIPTVFVPMRFLDPNGSPEDRAVGDAFKRLVTQVRRDQQEGLVLPSDPWLDGQGSPTGLPRFKFELLSSGGSRVFDTSRIIDRWDRRIATAVLADFILLGQQAVGSFALSSDKTALFAQALGAYAKRMAETLDGVVDQLWELNGFKADVKPRFMPGDLEKPEIDKLAAFLSALTASGMQLFPHRETENYLRKVGGLPLLSEDDELGLQPQDAPGDAPPPDQPASPAKKPIAKAIAELDEWLLASEHDRSN